MRWRLGKADAPLYYGIEHHILEMLPQFVDHLGVDLRPAVEHSYDESFDRKSGIDLVLHEPDGLEELAQALQGEVFRLDRDHYGISGGKGIDRDKSEGRGTVDNDVVIVVADRGKPLPEDGFAFRSLNHLDLSSDQVDVGRYHLKVVQLRLDQDVVDIDGADHYLIERALLVVVRRKIQPGGGVGLGVGVNYEHPFLEDCERCCEIDGGRGLSHSAFLVGYCQT